MSAITAWIKATLGKIPFKNILLGIIAFTVVFLLYVSWWKPHPVDPQSIIDDIEARMKKQYEADMQAQADKIAVLTRRLNASDKRHIELSRTLEGLKNETIAPPKTNKELRDRFAARGFAPLP